VAWAGTEKNYKEGEEILNQLHKVCKINIGFWAVISCLREAAAWLAVNKNAGFTTVLFCA
jgi:hypothetical protein